MDEMFTNTMKHYIDMIPHIVKCKLRDFDENNLRRPAVPTFGISLRNFFELPEDIQNEIIHKYIQALGEVGIICTPITDRKIIGKGWYLKKEP